MSRAIHNGRLTVDTSSMGDHVRVTVEHEGETVRLMLTPREAQELGRLLIHNAALIQPLEG